MQITVAVKVIIGCLLLAELANFDITILSFAERDILLVLRKVFIRLALELGD